MNKWLGALLMVWALVWAYLMGSVGPGSVAAQTIAVEVVPATEIPDYCQLTSKIGVIENYYCEPEVGPYYVANNAGFLQAVE